MYVHLEAYSSLHGTWYQLCLFKFYVYQELLNMIVLGNGIFEDVNIYNDIKRN